MSISSLAPVAASSAQAAAQEAMETSTQTKAEALKGDQQALRKLNRQQQTAESSEPAKGDNEVSERGFNASA